MRKILIIVAAMTAIEGHAMASEKTFDEAFPAPQSGIEDFCNRSPAQMLRNGCIDSAQQDYDYDKAVWSSLDRTHQEICEDRWTKMAEGHEGNLSNLRLRFHLIAGCLNDQWRAQDRETVHHFNH